MSETRTNDGSGEDADSPDDLAEVVRALAETLLPWRETGQIITAPLTSRVLRI